jgi:hypothetical protein
MLCAVVEHVDILVLVVQCFVQYSTSKSCPLKHASDKGLEFDIAVIELVWDWAL